MAYTLNDDAWRWRATGFASFHWISFTWATTVEISCSKDDGLWRWAFEGQTSVGFRTRYDCAADFETWQTTEIPEDMEVDATFALEALAAVGALKAQGEHYANA
jgi:hypothetical protein